MIPSTVIFDVDGTLIDSNGAHASSWQQALAEHGHPVALDDVRRAIGMGGDKLLPTLAGIDEESTAGKAIGARKKALFAALLPTLEPTRGVRALIEFLRGRGVTVAVATSAGDDEVAALLAQANVNDLLETRASRDDAVHSKPDPDIVNAALSQAGTTADKAVMVGDTPYDLEAASRAGVPAIALRCGGAWDDRALSEAVAILDDPAALLDHWRAALAEPVQAHVSPKAHTPGRP